MRLFVFLGSIMAISLLPAQQSLAQRSDISNPPVTIDLSSTETAEFADGTKFDAMHSELVESTAGFPFQPDPPAEGVTITLAYDRIRTTTYEKFVATANSAPSSPSSPQVGDIRTYSRTQDNIKETWTQEYKDLGGSQRWVTTSYTWEVVEDKEPRSEEPS